MEATRLLLVLALLSGSLRSGRSLDEGLGSKELLAEEPNGYPERLLDWMVSASATSPKPTIMGGGGGGAGCKVFLFILLGGMVGQQCDKGVYF